MGGIVVTANEAIEKYIEKFGWFPTESVGIASDEYIIEYVEKALKEGKEPDIDWENKKH